MPRKASSAMIDPNQPLDPEALDDSLGLPGGVQVTDAPPIAIDQPAWPDVAWKEHDLRILRFANNVPTDADLAAIQSMGMTKEDLRREIERVQSVAVLLPQAGTRSELARLERQEEETRERLLADREAADRELADAMARHREKIRTIDEEVRKLRNDSFLMRSAQEALDRQLPQVAQEAFFTARRTYRDVVNSGEVATQLKDTRATVNFIRNALAFRMVETQYNPRTNKSEPMPTSLQPPEWLWNPESLGYIGPKPELTELPMGETPTAAIAKRCNALWESKRAELEQMLPQLRAELEALELEHRRQIEAALATVHKRSYVPE